MSGPPDGSLATAPRRPSTRPAALRRAGAFQARPPMPQPVRKQPPSHVTRIHRPTGKAGVPNSVLGAGPEDAYATSGVRHVAGARIAQMSAISSLPVHGRVGPHQIAEHRHFLCVDHGPQPRVPRRRLLAQTAGAPPPRTRPSGCRRAPGWWKSEVCTGLNRGPCREDVSSRAPCGGRWSGWPSRASSAKAPSAFSGCWRAPRHDLHLLLGYELPGSSQRIDAPSAPSAPRSATQYGLLRSGDRTAAHLQDECAP
jgi:hypothetical protein